MGLTQKTIVSCETMDGTAVKIRQETITNVLQATTVEGETVFISAEQPEAKAEITVTIEFDDLVDGPKRTLEYDITEPPDAAWKVIKLVLFDGKQLVFSDHHEVVHFLDRFEPLKSPREAKILSFPKEVTQ